MKSLVCSLVGKRFDPSAFSSVAYGDRGLAVLDSGL